MDIKKKGAVFLYMITSKPTRNYRITFKLVNLNFRYHLSCSTRHYIFLEIHPPNSATNPPWLVLQG